MKRIRFMVGGPVFHPVAQQAGCIAHWLSEGVQCELVHGYDAFDDLEGIDLVVIMGLFWEGMADDWAGNMTYVQMPEDASLKFETYVKSGRPLMLFHGGVASYPEDPRFSELLGVKWAWDHTTHNAFGDQSVRILDTGHPLVSGLTDVDIVDEVYYNLVVDESINPQIHAVAPHNGAEHPMMITGEGGRVQGAGKVVYLANGHDMQAFESPLIKQSWLNAVQWLLGE